MEAELKIKNAFIVTVDNNDTVFENGEIAISNGRIIAIGNAGELDYIEGHEIIDAQGGLVMPGLINAHTHAGMSIYRGMADDLPLQEWLHEHIFPAEANFCTAESVEIGTKLSVLEMIRFGITCFCDMYYFEENVAKVCNEIGIRAVLGQAILDFPAPDHKTSDDAILHTEKLITSINTSGLAIVVPGPHSIYTCSSETLLKARALANKYDLPMHIHLAETVMEYQECLEKFEKTPIQFCNDFGLFEGKTIAAHCVFVSEEDREILKLKNVGVVNNPVSNMKLSSGVAPVPLLRDAGVRVGLGTDSVVSHNTLDIFEEMKIAALVHKVNSNNPTALDAKTTIRMATIENARILGLDKEIGSLEVDKKADLIIVDINQPHLMPLYNIFSQIVYAVKGSDVDTVLIDGKIVMLNRVIQNVDIIDIAIDAQLKANEVKEFFTNRNASQE